MCVHLDLKLFVKKSIPHSAWQIGRRLVSKVTCCRGVLAVCLVVGTSDAFGQITAAEDVVRIGTINHFAISESSGLTASQQYPGTFWTHNDGGYQFLFAITQSGEMQGAFQIVGANLIDWEAIASDNNGNLYLVLIACLWLSSSVLEKGQGQTTPSPVTSFIQRYKGAFITAILCLQIPGGIFAWGMDLVYPFSAIRATADYIKAAGLQEMRVVASDERFVSPITGYLEKTFYYPDSERFGTHIVYNAGTRGRSSTEILERVRQFLNQGQPAVLLVLSFKLTDPSPDLTIKELKHFESGIVGDEEYFLYLVGLM